MGVMTCNRKGCSEIMCDTYVDTIGYICGSCKWEFEQQYGEKLSEREIYQNLHVFMDTDKENQSDEEIDLYDFFSKHTI